MRIKQLCSHKVWNFATAFRVQKHFGTFKKRAPGPLNPDRSRGPTTRGPHLRQSHLQLTKPSKTDTSYFLTNMFSNLRSLWTYPCLCMYSRPLEMSFAHRIVVLSVGAEDGNVAGIFLGLLKMCLIKFSLHSSITRTTLTWSPSFNSDEP